MGYDQDQRSSSSGAVVAIVVAGLIFAILVILAVAGAGYLLVGRSSMQPQTLVVEQQSVAEVQLTKQMVADAQLTKRAVAQARLSGGTPQIRVVATPDLRLNFEVAIDREGNASIDGENIDLDELRAKLVKLQEETSDAFTVHISAEPECPVKHVVAVVAVCNDVGDIDYRIKSAVAPTVKMTATVVSYEPAAEWDHFDDGTFSAYDKMTLQVVSPERHAGKTFSVTVPPTEFPDDSAFRTTGTGLSFTVRESDIGATGLAWGAVGDPAIEQ